MHPDAGQSAVGREVEHTVPPRTGLTHHPVHARRLVPARCTRQTARSEDIGKSRIKRLKSGLITAGGGVMVRQEERIAALETEIVGLREQLSDLRVLAVAELGGVLERLAGVEKQLDVFTLTLALRLMRTGQPVPEGLVNRLLPDVAPLEPEPAGPTLTDAGLLALKSPQPGAIPAGQPPRNALVISHR